MDSQNASCVDQNICRCCLKDGCFMDISVEYYQCGEKEVYEHMLKDTFDIQIKHDPRNNSTSRRFICDDCILKLRDAYAFKKMVIHNEESFQRCLDGLTFKENMKSQFEFDDNIVKIEALTESVLELTDAADSFEDNDIKPAPSMPNIRIKSLNKKRGRIREVGRRCNGDKTKNTIQDNHKSSDTKPKACDRRGNARILRENTLKLLENSSICVFQWNKSRYRCFCCAEPFNEIDSLKEHTSSKHSLLDIKKKIIKQQNLLVKADISILKCQICKASLLNIDNLQNHLSNAHDVTFLSLEHLFIPFKIKDGGLTCQICFENFNLFRVLNIHMNKHYQRHICDKCGAGFSSLMYLNLHRTRLHREFRCAKCNVAFNNKIDVRNHEIKVHDIKYERRKRFPCPFCDERFFQESLRVEHLVQKHDLIRPEFKCNFCFKSFITKSLVNNHTKYVHFKEKIHECNICHNYFYTRTDLNRHKNIHIGGKKFTCNICNNSFASKESLRRHSKRSHSE